MDAVAVNTPLILWTLHMVDQNSQFYAILTTVGAAKQANADALGIPWKITQMGVGDANGTDPTPNATQTALIGEWRRAPLNQLKVDEKDNAIIVAEQVIPADVGGRWIREIGLYDADGDLVAVANCAPTYKPLLSQGSGRTQVVRMSLVVSSASNVQLRIDPSVVLATREWVTEELARQDFKHSVLVATTTAVTLSGLQTIDGVALQVGNRVLVKDQNAAKDNGLYVVAAGAWGRSTDADSNAKVTPGLMVLVEKGTANSDSAWQLVTDGPINLGVTSLSFEMAFGRTGVAASTYRSVTVDKYGRVVAATNPTTVAGYGLTDVYTKSQVDTELALKSPLISPALAGVPTAPTAARGNNSQQLANTAFVTDAISTLIAGSPGALDTLKELADALGNDPNFATTVLNRLNAKADKASTLAGYGITDDAQIRGQNLIGAFTMECLDISVYPYASGILIKTKLPAWDGGMPTLTIKGALDGYTTPFEAQLNWYYWEDAIYQPKLQVSGPKVAIGSGFNAYLIPVNGLIHIRLELGLNAYIPRLTITALRTRTYGADHAYYQDWTSEVYDSPIAGEVKAERTVVLNSRNISAPALGLAKDGEIPVSAVTGLTAALNGKAPSAHAHVIADVTGLAASLNLASGLAASDTTQDPNLAVNQVILTNHANAPVSGFYWHITTSFYNTINAASNRAQTAVQYNGGSEVYVRSYFNGQWTAWDRLDKQVWPGTIVYFLSNLAPPGYLKANGAQISRTSYARLFSAIGTYAGAGDGSTTFHLPDLRGEFLRGWDDARGLDANRALGSLQSSQNLSHVHTGVTDVRGSHIHLVSGNTTSGGAHAHPVNRAQNNSVGALADRVTTAYGDAGTAAAISVTGEHAHTFTGSSDYAGAHDHSLIIYADGGSEARPRNLALLACIKY